jgi:hypothetical protein
VRNKPKAKPRKRMTANARKRWKAGTVHPVTRKAVGGQYMTLAERKKYTRTGKLRSAVKAAAVRKGLVKKKPAKRKAPAKRKTAKRNAGKRTASKRYYVKKSGAPSSSHTWRKGYTTATGKQVPGRWVKKGGAKKKTARKKPAKRKAPAKRKTAARRKPAKKTARFYRKKSGAPRGHVWRKGYRRSDGKFVKGMWVKKASKAKRKAKPRKKTAYKRKKVGVVSRKRTKAGKTTVRRKKMSYRTGGKAGRYRVKTKSKRYKKKSYLRRRPKRRTATMKKRTYKRKYPRQYVRRSRGGKVWRKGYVIKSGPAKGKRVKGQWVKKPKRGRYKITGSGKAKRMAANKSRRRSNPYKRKGKSYHKGKGWIKPYSYRNAQGKLVKVKGHRRRQWYPTRYPKKGKGRWISQRKAHQMGLMGKLESRKFGFAANPAALAMLPTRDQLMAVGQAAGVTLIGFGGAAAAGRAFAGLGFAQRYLGTWAPVVGNVLAGIGMWTVANMVDNPKVNEAKPYLAIGAGVTALVNVVLNLIARGTVPSRYASWIIPGAGAVEAVPEAVVEPLPEGTAGFGQIDVYEAALDGLGDIEQDLEAELERMSGMGADDGIFGDEGVFGEYIQSPLGATVEEAYAGMGAEVEEAFAGGGSGGVGEYLETPMGGVGEYLETPMGAEVEEAFAGGTGEYIDTGTGEYLETPMGGFEEAYGGMGQNNGFMEEFQSSVANQPLMPGFRSAVQRLVRKRVAAGQPLDDAFYSKLGRAAAQLARKKFRRRVAQVQGKAIDLPVTQPRPRLTRKGAPMYIRPVGSPPVGRVPGAAEPIPSKGAVDEDGIFANGSGIL